MVESIKELRNICRKSNYKDEAWLSRNFYRKISIYFTKLSLIAGISANQATLLSLLFALIGGFFLIFTDIISWIISALFLFLYFIFDGVDGEIARYTKTSSKLGSHLDFMVGTFVHPYAFICMTFGAYNALHDIIIFAFGFLAVTLNLLHEMHRISYEVKSANISKNTSEGESFVWKLYGLVRGVNNFLNPGAILYPILIFTALDICFAPLSINIPIIGLFAINARYAFLIVYGVGKLSSFVLKLHSMLTEASE